MVRWITKTDSRDEKLDPNALRCGRCHYTLGIKSPDEQYLRIGKAQFWRMTYGVCDVCERPFRWNPKPLPRDPEEVKIGKKIRNNLARGIEARAVDDNE
jgi:hypothetical protein